MNRRNLIARASLAFGSMALGALPRALAAAPLPPVEVFRNPSCGCCGAWIEHLQAAGFEVKVTMVTDTAPVRRKLGLADAYGSCHTAVVGGYVVEGHVPASDVKKLLAMKVVALGLAVPGMPVGSPGMEMGSQKDPYDVLLIDRQGKARVFSSHNPRRG